MKFALLAAIAFAPLIGQDPGTTRFTEPFVGLQFDHPSDWTLVKKEKDRSVLSIPVPGSTEPAELQIVRTQFHADKDLWQTVQLRINEQLSREVVRQWEQEVLGVPLLFTKINYGKDGVARSTLTGLYYTRTNQKMLVRLDSRESDFDNVSYAMLKAFETLRMVDGSTPQPDDPALTLDTTPGKPVPVVAPPRVLDDGKDDEKIVKPGGTVDLTVAEKPVKLLFAEGWVAKDVEGGKLTLTHPEVSQPVTVEVFSLLDSDPARTALFRASSASLSRFTKVESREDKARIKNRAGATIATIWRIGKSADGNLATYYAAGETAGHYFLATFEQTDLDALKVQRKAVDSLIDLMTIEVAP